MVDFDFGPEAEGFRAEAREWLAARLGPGGPFAALRGAGGGADLTLRREWERELGRGRWIGLGWAQVRPELGEELDSYGVRGDASLAQQVVWAEEYARAAAPASLLVVGEQLLAPTLLACGSAEQRARFLPGIAAGEEVWCQGYSEPEAGSDLSAVRTRAVRDGAGWRVTGQKIWTSLAQYAGWCFALCRTDPESERHRGLSFLLLRMDQPERIEVRPIRQLTGDGEFNEVFFDGAYAEELVGAEGDGWRVAMTLLSFERGAGMLGRQIGFERELAAVIEEARRSGAVEDPVLRERLVRQWADLHVLRCNALATLGRAEPGAASVSKLLWGGWHQRLGELALAVGGPRSALRPDGERYLTDAQHLALFSRADTIYGGSDQIQREVIAGRVLGLPRAR